MKYTKTRHLSGLPWRRKFRFRSQSNLTSQKKEYTEGQLAVGTFDVSDFAHVVCVAHPGNTSAAITLASNWLPALL